MPTPKPICKDFLLSLLSLLSKVEVGEVDVAVADSEVVVVIAGVARGICIVVSAPVLSVVNTVIFPSVELGKLAID